jgi:predicted PurR-regulated permease PerM
VRLGKWIGFVALLLSLYVLWRVRQVVLLLFMAVVLATPLNRLVRRFRRAGVKRGVAVLLSVSCLLICLLFFVGMIVPPFVDQFQQLANLVPQGLDRVRVLLLELQALVPATLKPYVPGVDDLIRQARPLVAWVFNNFFSLFSNFLLIILNLLLVLVLMIMLLVNPVPYRRGVLLLAPAFYRSRVDQILTACEADLVGWMRGVLIDMAAVGIAAAIGLWVLQVPLVFTNAALAGLLQAVPTIGPTASLIPPMAIALLDAPWKAGAVLILYFSIQQLEQYLLMPFVMQKQVALLPAITLLSQVVFAFFFGLLGLFLAIPLVIIGKIVIREVLIKDVFDRMGGSSESHFKPRPDYLRDM